MTYEEHLEVYRAVVELVKNRVMKAKSGYAIKSKENVVLQLCDILPGSVSEAVEKRVERQAKLELGKKSYFWILDIRKNPWEQKYGLHKILNLWYFPDRNGAAYNERLFILQVILIRTI